MTNAELIRNMNDDELALFIRSVYLAGKNGEGFAIFDFNLELWLQKQSTKSNYGGQGGQWMTREKWENIIDHIIYKEEDSMVVLNARKKLFMRLYDDYVRDKKEKETKEEKKMRYSEPIMDDVYNIIKKFLHDHEVYKLMEIVTDAIATEEQAD